MTPRSKTYNKNVEETNTKITELTDSLDDLKSDYEQAERDATTQKAELQNEYDTAVVEGKYAGSTYESTVSELESAVESAQDTLDTLKEEQTALLALENGVVTADEDGTIAAVPYEAEDTLQSGTAFALYCDTQTIMISVEVPQENIAQVGVGDEVSVMIAGNRDGAVTGTVSSIASSATTGGSVSNVTYAVIISIDNSDGRLGSGSSATVTFQGEQEEKTEMKKKKVTVVLSLGAAALLLIGGISVYAHQTSDSGESETVYKETTAEYGTLTVGITESGSVTIGSISQDMDEDISTSSNSGSSQTSGTQTTGTSTNNSSVVLEVEEVYVSVGQQVKAGDALLKLTDESIEKYRKKLKEAVTEASADYNSAALSSAKEKVSANYSYNLSVAEGSVAQEEYEATISELQDAVDEAQEAVDESQALLTYYQEMIDSGMDLSESLADEQENYDKLYNKLKAAKSAYTTKSVEAEKKYKEAMLSYENADSQYSADVTGVDVSVDTAQDTLTDAKEALSEFEIFVGDGTIYSDYDGTIMSVGYEAGDDLSAGTSIVTFADTDAVTMTVSVSEEDISEIAIGDEVMIELNAYEDQTFSGEVESIDTSVSSGSSTVSYNVTVKINGDVDGIYTDMTGNVTFIEKQVADVVYVSNKAIINEGTASYVKVKDSDGTIEKKEVTTGFSDGVNVEITEGLSEGETVLIESQVTGE